MLFFKMEMFSETMSLSSSLSSSLWKCEISIVDNWGHPSCTWLKYQNKHTKLQLLLGNESSSINFHFIPISKLKIFQHSLQLREWRWKKCKYRTYTFKALIACDFKQDEYVYFFAYINVSYCMKIWMFWNVFSWWILGIVGLWRPSKFEIFFEAPFNIGWFLRAIQSTSSVLP